MSCKEVPCKCTKQRPSEAPPFRALPSRQLRTIIIHCTVIFEDMRAIKWQNRPAFTSISQLSWWTLKGQNRSPVVHIFLEWENQPHKKLCRRSQFIAFEFEEPLRGQTNFIHRSTWPKSWFRSILHWNRHNTFWHVGRRRSDAQTQINQQPQSMGQTRTWHCI